MLLYNENESWPQKDLQKVPECPICGSSQRLMLYTKMKDRTFFCAPGEWSIYKCLTCKSGYLDPRPTPETIKKAYSTYFTHSVLERKKFDQLSVVDQIRRLAANGYRNKRFGFERKPAFTFGSLIVNLFPSHRSILEADMRHLYSFKKKGHLLDVGCGNGLFLSDMKSAGWKVTGIDFDPKAIKAAKLRGLEVYQGGIEIFADDYEVFDVITISHVIEHVYNPSDMLMICHKLLKPGGWLWIETPNIDSQGHQLFGENWRDLDPPRHLILFSHWSLIKILNEAGFHSIIKEPYRPLCREVFSASEAIACGLDPINNPQLTKKIKRLSKKSEELAINDPAIREFITVIATK